MTRTRNIKHYIIKFLILYLAITLIHSITYISFILILISTQETLHADLVIVNSVVNINITNLIEGMKLANGTRILLLNGDIVTYYLLALGKIESNTTIIIAHGCGNAIALIDDASILNLIIHGPLGLLGLVSSMYIPRENSKHLALTQAFFSYIFNPKTRKIIIISCDVDNIVDVLKGKGYEVSYTTTMESLIESFTLNHQ